MKELFKNKLIWVVLVLIILNLLSLGMVWCSHGCSGSGRGGDHWKGKGKHNKEFLSDELNFTPEQKAALVKLRETHFAEVKAKKDKVHELKKELFNLPEDAASSDSAARHIADEIGKLDADLEWSRFKHFQQVYNLCDENQKKRFKDVLKEIHEQRDAGHNNHKNWNGGHGGNNACKK